MTKEIYDTATKYLSKIENLLINIERYELEIYGDGNTEYVRRIFRRYKKDAKKSIIYYENLFKKL
ncbi:MAG: hypothetical protein LBE36_13535 [Flavobacteriaceae bacterium]|jgi:sporulation protein YlmC with PRC-barrel domain|nr:hypothetical protein [Flavobacteriaceae bacterium]